MEQAEASELSRRSFAILLSLVICAFSFSVPLFPLFPLFFSLFPLLPCWPPIAETCHWFLRPWFLINSGLDPPPVYSVQYYKSHFLREIRTKRYRHLKANRLPDTRSLGFSSVYAISECSWVWSTPPTRDRSSYFSVLASPLGLIHQSYCGTVSVCCTVVTDA